jgi:hypothetical protein
MPGGLLPTSLRGAEEAEIAIDGADAHLWRAVDVLARSGQEERIEQPGAVFAGEGGADFR